MSPASPKELAEKFLRWFNTIWDNDQPVTLAEVGQYIAPSIQFYLNGEHLADGIQAYLDRLNALKRQCRMLKIKFPVEFIIAEGNRAAVNYRETLTYHDGSIHQLTDAVFFQFDDHGKITHFVDVFGGSDPVKS